MKSPPRSAASDNFALRSYDDGGQELTTLSVDAAPVLLATILEISDKRVAPGTNLTMEKAILDTFSGERATGSRGTLADHTPDTWPKPTPHPMPVEAHANPVRKVNICATKIA